MTECDAIIDGRLEQLLGMVPHIEGSVTDHSNQILIQQDHILWLTGVRQSIPNGPFQIKLLDDFSLVE